MCLQVYTAANAPALGPKATRTSRLGQRSGLHGALGQRCHARFQEVPVVGGVMLWLCMGSRWRVCRACVWLMLVGVWLWRGLEVGSCPGRVLLRTRAVMLCLRAAGGARVSVASRWALRSGSCRLGCALVGAASYTNGLGMALLSPSMCRSSRECRGRCLMGMDRYAILLIFNL